MKWSLFFGLIFFSMCSSAQASLPSEAGSFPNYSLPGEYLRQQVINSRLFPWSNVGSLATSNPYDSNCTGTLVGPRHVLTAAHCVYNSETNEWYSNLKFYPGRGSQSGLYFGVYDWEKIYIPSSYKEFSRASKEAASQDYAIIFLKENAGEKLGWMGMSDPTNTSFFSELLDISFSGYPQDKPIGTLWNVACPATISGKLLNMLCDVYSGMSGSGIRVNTKQGPTLVGIVNMSSGVAGNVTSGINGGVVFSSEVLGQLRSWIADKVVHENTDIIKNNETKVTVYFQNDCPKARVIKAVFAYVNTEGQNVSSTFLTSIEERGAVPVLSTNRKSFFYWGMNAADPSMVWYGNNLTIKVGSDTMTLKREDFVTQAGVYILRFACP